MFVINLLNKIQYKVKINIKDRYQKQMQSFILNFTTIVCFFIFVDFVSQLSNANIFIIKKFIFFISFEKFFIVINCFYRHLEILCSYFFVFSEFLFVFPIYY